MGQRTWKRKRLCSNGDACPSRMRKRMRPSSLASSSASGPCFICRKETRAPFTTERSVASAASRRTKPWSRIWMVSPTDGIGRSYRPPTLGRDKRSRVGETSAVSKQRVTLGVIALAALALAIVALISISGGQSHRSHLAAVQGQTIHRDPGPSAAPSSSVSPTATPTPTPSAPPAPPPPPPDPYLHVGSHGADVQALQQKLTSLTYMTAGVDGGFGGGTRDALIAFQKVNGLKLTGEADPPTTDKLATAGPPTAAYSTPSDHLEVDIAKQVVYVVRGGTVANTLTTSTGSGQKFTSQGVTQRAITPNGAFNVYWKIPGWHDAPLGHLSKPSLFNVGIALHGYYEVPTYPASHGCVRLPMEFADWFYDKAAPPGATVYVY